MTKTVCDKRVFAECVCSLQLISVTPFKIHTFLNNHKFYCTCIYSKNETKRFYNGLIPPHDANGTVKTDETAPTVCPICLSKNLGSSRYYFVG